VPVEQGAAAAPRLGGDAADMQLQMVGRDPDRDQAGGELAVRIVVGRTPKPALDLNPVIDQVGPAGESDVCIP
jgi:hypothetical protein